MICPYLEVQQCRGGSKCPEVGYGDDSGCPHWKDGVCRRVEKEDAIEFKAQYGVARYS